MNTKISWGEGGQLESKGKPGKIDAIEKKSQNTETGDEIEINKNCNCREKQDDKQKVGGVKEITDFNFLLKKLRNYLSNRILALISHPGFKNSLEGSNRFFMKQVRSKVNEESLLLP